jgi:drug/metabolite transporter (DMT)-like permease
MNRKSAYVGGLLWALAAACCLSIAPTLIKAGLTAAMDPIPLLALRLVVAALVLWVIFAVFQREKLRIDRPGLLACLAVAAANSISLVCYYVALTRIHASVATLIFSLYPAVVLVLLALKGERLTRVGLARLGLALCGVYLLIVPGGTADPAGIVLACGTAVFYAVHLNLVQWRLRNYDSQTVTIYVVSLMALMLSVPFILQLKQWRPVSPAGWGVILATGVVSTAAARLAMFAAVRHIGSGQVALLGSVDTVLAVLWSLLFLGERLSPLQWSGSLLIVASASLIVARARNRHAAQ